MLRLAQPRRVSLQDYRPLSNLILREANVHRHLDWRSPLEWIGASNYWALEEDGGLTAALACPEDPPRVAWIRLFAYQPQLSALESWNALWTTARSELPPQTVAASIAVKPWFERVLLAAEFERLQNVVLLEYLPPLALRYQPPRDFHIRRMRAEDLPAVAQIDEAAFGWFWRYSLDSLTRARAAAFYASVAENENGLLGYQISTGGASCVHLARLAVQPQAQGRGVGAALVGEMISKTAARRYSVNTQQENAASLALYRRLGFSLTGERFPVLVYPSA